MSNVIDFLEQIGQDASLRYVQGDQLGRILDNAQIESGIKIAIAGRATRDLEVLLGATPNVCCGMHPISE
jgi:hypothetical protein